MCTVFVTSHLVWARVGIEPATNTAIDSMIICRFRILIFSWVGPMQRGQFASTGPATMTIAHDSKATMKVERQCSFSPELIRLLEFIAQDGRAKVLAQICQ